MIVPWVEAWLQRKGVMKSLAVVVVLACLGSGTSGCVVIPLLPGAAGVAYGAYKETSTWLSSAKDDDEATNAKTAHTAGPIEEAAK